MRLIDADELMEHSGWYNLATGKSIHGVQDFEIASMQTIDAVPVVRCRECKYYKDLGTYYQLMDCTHRDGLTNPYEDDFCSYGQRKEADHEVSEPGHERIVYG